jgi:Putative rhamnosyl transferase
MDHAILTRFNLPSVGAESVIRAKDDWLTQRVELFEHYCLPSVRAQSISDFRWLIYFDPESPNWLKERIESWTDSDRIVPLFRTEVPRDDLLSDIEQHVGRRDGWLITTNLDNDDALAVDFVERVQSAPMQSGRHALYLGNGLIRTAGSVYARRDRFNAFCSVREPWVDARTCWGEWHNLLPTVMPAESLVGQPGWLQVVHGNNVTNRIRGRLTDAAPYRDLFPGMLDDLTPEPRAAIARDALISAPRRWIVDRVRLAGKSAILAVGGKRGLDQIKWVLAKRHRSE